MKVICITGISRPHLQSIGDIIQTAGARAAQPLEQGSIPDLANWHERLLAQAAGDTTSAPQPPQPGRLWERLATELFLANIDAPVWYWTDPNSAWLLDFWHAFEPQLYFVLPTLSPSQYLTEVAQHTDSDQDAQAALEHWLAVHQRMLRFHLRHPERSLLLSAEDCLNAPQRLVEHCNERWSLSLDPVETSAPFAADADPLAAYLADQILRIDPRATSLQQELEASIETLIEPAEPDEIAETGSDVLQAFHALQERLGELLRLRADAEEREGLRASLEAQTENLAAALAKTETALKTLEHQQQETREENELLLLQLHQVQEELEANFLKAQEDTARFKKEKDALTKQLRDNESRLHQLEQDKQGLTKARDEQTKLAAQHQGRLKDLEGLEPQLKDIQEENELLLLQLHQVQEELERYFLMHQDSQQALKREQDRWQRMLARSPHYSDAEQIEVNLARDRGEGALDWRLRAVSIAGRTLDELHVTTVMQEQSAGLVIHRGPDGGSPLKRWPAAAGERTEICLLPEPDRQEPPAKADLLLDLSLSDWHLVGALQQLLREALTTPAMLPEPPSDLSTEELARALEKFGQALDRFPPVLRYDGVSLQREQINADYEHLWIVLENLEHLGQRWPRLELRLACANVGPERFGTHPKLEFPEPSDQTPFEQWFIESHDDFGPKLELRFALPNAVDLGVLNRLTQHDLRFMGSLIDRLPLILADLRQAGTSLTRPWEDWINLASSVQDIWRMHVPTPDAEEPAAEDAPPAEQTPRTDPPPTKTAQSAAARERAQSREPNSNVLRFWT